MLRVFRTFICLALTGLFFLSCSKKATDFQGLIKSYKQVMCTTMSATESSLKEREKGMKKLNDIKQECLESLKYLKQEEKEKFHQMMAEAELEVAEGKCD
jgi:hypothetical protein